MGKGEREKRRVGKEMGKRRERSNPLPGVDVNLFSITVM